MTKPTLHRAVGASTLALAVLALGACSEDDPKKDDAREPAAAAPTPVAEQPYDPTAFCTAIWDLTAASNEDLGFSPETATMKEIREGTMRWYGSEKAEGLMDTALSTAPSELADDTRTLVDGLQGYAATGDDRAVERTIGKSQGRIDRYLERECPEIVE